MWAHFLSTQKIEKVSKLEIDKNKKTEQNEQLIVTLIPILFDNFPSLLMWKTCIASYCGSTQFSFTKVLLIDFVCVCFGGLNCSGRQQHLAITRTFSMIGWFVCTEALTGSACLNRSREKQAKTHSTVNSELPDNLKTQCNTDCTTLRGMRFWSPRYFWIQYSSSTPGLRRSEWGCATICGQKKKKRSKNMSPSWWSLHLLSVSHWYTTKNATIYTVTSVWQRILCCRKACWFSKPELMCGLK